MRYTVVVLLLIMSASCAVMEESYVIVEASMQETGDSVAQKNMTCKLQMIRSGDLAEIDWRTVSAKVDEGFLIPATKDMYFFRIQCGDDRVFQSEHYSLGKHIKFGHIINLGEIEFEPEAPH